MSLKGLIIGAGRNVFVPLIGKGASQLGLTQEDIRTRVIKISAANISFDTSIVVDSDTHVGGVFDAMHPNVIATQSAIDELLKGVLYVASFDLGDLFTMGTRFWTNHGIQYAMPTRPVDLLNTARFLEVNAARSEGRKIFAIEGNHERDLTKMGLSDGEIGNLIGMRNELGIKKVIEPLNIGKKGEIQLLEMPCFDTSAEPYTNDSMKKLIDAINGFPSLSIIMTHNPDGVAYIEKYMMEQNKYIKKPALFLCGHSHGLLGLQGLPRPFGTILGKGARKWLKLRDDTQYVSGYYKLSRGGNVLVHQGMGDQKGLHRYLKGGRERIVLQFVEDSQNAEIDLNN